ncbi:CG10505 [Drosophila busckii]|uniref:CG10505 n=1 Tax=Drosophila busckii TaxID=30019 RepID=A0A0M4EXH0_DROBS|nr:probable multidrug resistance-associated protein lethal(2)03659 [Drosophila busckii]ALC42695.1 CG10505 [Drosophila busckii]
MRQIFSKGRTETLDINGLYAHLPSFDSERLTSELQEPWERESQRKQPNILHLIFKFYGCKFLPICVLYSIVEITIHSFQPLFLGRLISYFAEGQTSVSKESAYLYAMGVVLCSLVTSLLFHPFMFYMFDVGTKIRIACAGLIYRQCLRAAINASEGLGAVAISVMSIDLTQFDLSFYFLHDLWKGPVEACIFGYIMYRQVGWTALIGIAFIVLLIPLQAWAAQAAAKYRSRSSEQRDKRVQLMQEIIDAMQVIKMYAWEQCFVKLVEAVRQSEVKAIRGSMSIYAALQCTNMISKVSLFLSLVAYVYTGDVVTAQKVFVLSSYYSLLNDSLLHFWPLAITTWAQTVVSARRVLQFLQQTQQPRRKSAYDNPAFELEDKPKQQLQPVAPTVRCSHISASWQKSTPRSMQLSNISFELQPAQLVGIVGAVGAGKSSLLHVLLGELPLLQGQLQLTGKLSYAPQQPWIFQGSIRDNIVFVERYDEWRYRAVLQACQLQRDLLLWPQGDATMLGERGINLSGGQKARISLARAVYREADIYLFDDPLAAVDAQVGKLLMEQCLQRFLAGKLRILVTHHVQLLQTADQLLLLEAGQLSQQGSYAELQHLLLKHAAPEAAAARLSLQAERHSKRESLSAQLSAAAEQEQLHEAQLQESQAQGAVSWATYSAYFQALGAAGFTSALLVLALFVLARACQALMDIFISRWATFEEQQLHDSERTRRRMLIWYTLLLLGTLALYLLRTFGFFMLCLRISLRLHNLLFAGIIRARMRFFNENPSGRVLNRFASDIENVDVALPQALMDSLQFLVDVIAVLIIVAIANYWLLIPAAIMALLMFLCRSYYIGASRSLKRIESLTRSPVYSHTNQTFNGLTTIRALQATQQLEQTFHAHQNLNTSALFLYTSANRAFSFWTDLICGLYILAVTFSFLVVNQHFSSGDVGLAITQSITLVIMCQWGMRQTAEMENKMTSVERILEYAQTPSEAALETTKQLQLCEHWPESGHMRFQELRMRYTPEQDYILRGLSFELQPTEKVGIVGRTGAGKSSIIQAIFRLAVNEGLIEIDGQNIAHLGLQQLRSHISIIPQDPVLFSGSLRFNLDPLQQRTDEQIWQALQAVKLQQYVSSLAGGLDCQFQDGNGPFSIGQKQLVCLARAIVRGNRIIIMDEATANVDADTDQLIQQTMRTTFAHCTVLTIAHRLHTVMDYDRILVMDAGQIVEFGAPHQLLQNPLGALLKLVNQNDNSTVQYLKRIAADSALKKIKEVQED